MYMLSLTHPSLNIGTDSFVPLESSVHSVHVLPLVQLSQDVSHVPEPRLTQPCLTSELVCQLLQFLLSHELLPEGCLSTMLCSLQTYPRLQWGK